MAHSGEVWILGKIAELAKRCGVSPAVADVELSLHFRDNDDGYYYSLTGLDGWAKDAVEQEKVAKVWSLLGIDSGDGREFSDLPEVEKAVDHALSQIRPRTGMDKSRLGR